MSTWAAFFNRLAHISFFPRFFGWFRWFYIFDIRFCYTKKTWSFTTFKPDKSTKRCEADGFYFVEKLTESPIDGFEFKNCYFESGTDRVACCMDIRYQYGSKNADYCESYYFQKRFSGNCVVEPVVLNDYFEGDVNEWSAEDL